jgi:xanthine dehydrogenase small subunit
LLTLRAQHPDALLLAGGTDLGLLASRSRKPPKKLIHLAHVLEMTTIVHDNEWITLGGAVTYARALPVLVAAFPALGPYLSRLGSRQIRSMGTIGGNIGTASPIGDMPPVLLALGAQLTLASVRGTRKLPLDRFFLDYRKTALAPDEVIKGIAIEKLWRSEVFYCDKVSKRRDQDISTVAGAYRLRLRTSGIIDVRIAFGGMSAVPKRADKVELALIENGFDAAIAALAEDFRPIDDWRGTAAYRLQIAGNLLRRLKLRLDGGQPVELDSL